MRSTDSSATFARSTSQVIAEVERVLLVQNASSSSVMVKQREI